MNSRETNRSVVRWTLAQLPVGLRWILIAGLAVNARIERVHRTANGVDAVTHHQTWTLRRSGVESIQIDSVRATHFGGDVNRVR
jgi:hypothetical protein